MDEMDEMDVEVGFSYSLYYFNVPNLVPSFLGSYAHSNSMSMNRSTHLFFCECVLISIWFDRVEKRGERELFEEGEGVVKVV